MNVGPGPEHHPRHETDTGDGPFLLAGIAVLSAVYLLTLLPGVGYNGDTARFQLLGKILGTPHATGYPTYILLNGLLQRLVSWGSPAIWSNMLSSLFAVAASATVFLLLRRIRIVRWISLAAMLTLGLTRMFWSQAVVAEVYTLNALFLALVLYLVLAWNQDRRRRHLWAAILVYALSFGNHLTMITCFPALVVFVAFEEPRVFRDPKTMLWSVGAVVVGAGEYAFLLWRYHDPTTVFMETHVPDLAHLWRVVSGEKFQSRMFAQPVGRWCRREPRLSRASCGGNWVSFCWRSPRGGRAETPALYRFSGTGPGRKYRIHAELQNR